MPKSQKISLPKISSLNPSFFTKLESYWKAVDKASDISVEEALKTKQNLAKFAFRKIFEQVYLKAIPKVKGDIYFGGLIHADGVGDYFAMLKSAKVYAEKKYPGIKVHLFYRHQKPLPEVDLKRYLISKNDVYGFYEPTDYQVLAPVLAGIDKLNIETVLKELEEERVLLEGTPLEFYKDLDLKITHFKEIAGLKSSAIKFYEELKKSIAIVQIALAINTFDNPVLSPKSLYFAETGNFQGIANYLQRNWHGMGLDPFEEGIFLKKTFKKSAPWQDKKIARLLFKTDTPSSSDISSYQKGCRLNLCYQTRSLSQQLTFIYLILMIRSHEACDIDLIYPKLVSGVIEQLDLKFLKSAGIKSVLVVEKEIEKLIETGLREGKDLRIIHYNQIPSSDFEKLVSLSQDFVGCTGDQSLSECLGDKKIPYYEMCAHKTDTWMGLKGLAQGLKLIDVPAYLDMMKSQSDSPLKDAETIYHIYRRESFSKEWGLLIKFIHKHCSFEKALVAHVNRFLCLLEKPSLKDFEEGLVNSYLKGAMKAKEAQNKLSAFLLA